MKILICTSCSLPIPAIRGGAVESLIQSLIDINEQNDTKLNINVICLDGGQTDSKYEKTSFIKIKKNNIINKMDNCITMILRYIKKDDSINNKNFLWKSIVLWETNRILKKMDYDKVIIENTPFLLNVLKSKKVRKKFDKKVFFHLHNRIKFSKGLEKNLGLCNSIISISQFLADDLRNTFPNLDLSISILNNGIPSFFKNQLSVSERDADRKKLGYQSDEKIVLFVGRVSPEKGIGELMTSLKYLETSISLLIVGKSFFGSASQTPYEKKIKNFFSEYQDQIKFTGFINNHNLWKYYQISDVVVLPSTWEEPLGLTMMEAKMSGVPIITTRKGGIPETVDAKYSILLEVDKNLPAKIASSIQTVLDNHDEWKEKAWVQREKSLTTDTDGIFFKNFFRTIKGEEI